MAVIGTTGERPSSRVRMRHHSLTASPRQRQRNTREEIRYQIIRKEKKTKVNLARPLWPEALAAVNTTLLLSQYLFSEIATAPPIQAVISHAPAAIRPSPPRRPSNGHKAGLTANTRQFKRNIWLFNATRLKVRLKSSWPPGAT